MVDWSQYKNFAKHEFDCKKTGKNDMKPWFLDILQSIRAEYGKPMVPTSGYRDKTHPAEAKKASPGAHTLGVAVDIAVRGLDDVQTLINIASGYGIKRIGISARSGAGWFVHLDMADRIDPKRFPVNTLWTY